MPIRKEALWMDRDFAVAALGNETFEPVSRLA
jgi:hypothetical protein